MPKTKVLEQHQHPKYPRLTVDLRSNSRFYQARTFLDGKLTQKSTKTTSLTTAFKLAEEWYRRLIRSSEAYGMSHPVGKVTKDPTVAEVFSNYRSDLNTKKRAYADKKWSPIAAFWKSLLIREISAQTFREFYKWRRKQEVVNHTLHKDVVLIRQILKHAIEDAQLPALPIIPKVGKIATNPQPWLTPQQYRNLLRKSEKRIKESTNPRLRKQRQDIHDLVVFLVHSMCRVDEVYPLRFRDCRVETNDEGDKMLLIDLSIGKMGGRTAVAMAGAASVYERRWRASGDRDARIFPERHKDGFHSLLEAADLHFDKTTGFERNMRSLRCTSISFRLLNNPDLNLQWIARNAGTSAAMIDTFYAKRLTAEMNKHALSSMPKPRTRGTGERKSKA